MAEVKLKNGYLRISNSLFENLCIRNFSKRELQIILFILRFSYGYQKKTAYIKPKNWFSVCGIPRPDIFRTLRGLIAKNVIRDLGNNTYSLNKNYDEWAVTYPKSYDEDKLNILKMIQKNGSKTLPKEVVKCDRKEKQNTTENGSEILPKTVVNYDQENNRGSQNTTENGSEILPKTVVNYDRKKDESEDGAIDLIGSKYNKDNKDNINKHTLLIAGKEVAKNVCVILKNYAKKMGAKNVDAYVASLVKNNAHIQIYEQEIKKAEIKNNSKTSTYTPDWKKPDFVPATEEETIAGLAKLKAVLAKKRGA